MALSNGDAPALAADLSVWLIYASASRRDSYVLTSDSIAFSFDDHRVPLTRFRVGVYRLIKHL